MARLHPHFLYAQLQLKNNNMKVLLSLYSLMQMLICLHQMSYTYFLPIEILLLVLLRYLFLFCKISVQSYFFLYKQYLSQMFITKSIILELLNYFISTIWMFVVMLGNQGQFSLFLLTFLDLFVCLYFFRIIDVSIYLICIPKPH